MWQGDRYEIAVKIPEATTPEQFREMLRNLLQERFKLAIHFEKKEMPGYELVAAKGGPKLKPTEPPKADAEEKPPVTMSSDNRNSEGFPIVPRGANGTISVAGGKTSWGASEVTMREFAGRLGDQVNQPVADATGLTGKYDIVLMWVQENSGRRPALAAQTSEAAPAAADPEGGPTLTSALQNQLGLKLQAKKLTIDFLVIDHIEKAPTEN
jgi:uncharacterized protein (TIGR03435 family)